jgi:hypothetical protein
MNSQQQNQLIEAMSAIQHISLNEEDLMSSLLDFCKIYQKQQNNKTLDSYLKDQKFLFNSLENIRMSIIIGMLTITIDEKISMKEMIGQIYLYCEKQNCSKDQEIILKEIKKEFFSRTLSQNKKLLKYTKVHHKIIDERKEDVYNYFINA